MALLPLFNKTLRFRWLIVLLAAISLLMPHLISEKSRFSPANGVQTAVVHVDGGAAQDHESDVDAMPDCVAELGDTHAGDHPHEMDKIFSLFAFHWDASASSWAGVYFARLAPDPVFSFERPPKASSSRA